MRGDIDHERSDALMCRLRIATLWSEGHLDLIVMWIICATGQWIINLRLDTFCLMRSGPALRPGATCESIETVGKEAHHVLQQDG